MSNKVEKRKAESDLDEGGTEVHHDPSIRKRNAADVDVADLKYCMRDTPFDFRDLTIEEDT